MTLSKRDINCYDNSCYFYDHGKCSIGDGICRKIPMDLMWEIAINIVEDADDTKIDVLFTRKECKSCGLNKVCEKKREVCDEYIHSNKKICITCLYLVIVGCHQTDMGMFYCTKTKKFISPESKEEKECWE